MCERETETLLGALAVTVYARPMADCHSNMRKPEAAQRWSESELMSSRQIAGIATRRAIFAALPLLLAFPAATDAADGDLPPGSAARSPAAQQAATVSVKDVAKLHLVGGSGNTLIEEGHATGTLPGSARVALDVGTATVTSSFTIHLSSGSISGRGAGQLHPGKSGRYDSFGGSVSISDGSGHYAHALGTGGFYGVIDRSDYNAEVQVIGQLHT